MAIRLKYDASGIVIPKNKSQQKFGQELVLQQRKYANDQVQDFQTRMYDQQRLGDQNAAMMEREKLQGQQVLERMNQAQQFFLSPLNAQIDPMGIWRITFFVGMVAMVIYLAKRFAKDLGWDVTGLWAYSLVIALWIVEFPMYSFGIYHVAYQATAGMNFAEVLLIPATLLLVRKNLLPIFTPIIVYEIIAVWFKLPGLMIPRPFADSFDLALMAMYFPFAPWWLKIATVGTVATHHGSTALLILGAQLAVWAFKTLDRKKCFYVTAIGAALVLGLAYYHSNAPLCYVEH